MRTRPIGPDRFADFVALPDALHGGAPGWVPPLREPLLLHLSGQGAFGRYGRLQPFLCEADGAVRGRVCALVNPRLADDGGRPIGQLGSFEAADDLDVARSLVDAACAWLRERGAREVWGPIDGGAHRAHRFMVEGFERDPFLLEPRNPAFYPRLFERLGFEAFHTWDTFELDVDELREKLTAAGLGRVAQRGARRWRCELLEPRDPARTFARLHPLLDGVWDGHVGYAPLDLAELAETFGGLLAVMSEQVQVAVATDGELDVGLAFMYPDWVEQARALGGSAAGWASWMGREPLPRRAVMHTIAALPRYRRTAAAYVVLERGLRVLEDEGVSDVVVALVTETYRTFGRIAEPTRRYALYRRAIDG